MKWLFYVVVFIYMAYRAVYGVTAGNSLSIDKVDYGNGTFFQVGLKKTINCRATSRNQRMEWVDPLGKVVKRAPGNRVFAQELWLSNSKGGRAPALVLTFTELLVQDTGTYKCRSGNRLQEQVSICVIKPSEFIDTPTEVTAELGRAITLSCQAKGDPEPKLVWRRNYDEISEQNDSSKYTLNTEYLTNGFKSHLTILSLEPEDSGQYECVSEQSLQGCATEDSLNITLQVSFAPIFENGNNTKIVYGKINTVVDLICSAMGFPTPTYRWFKVVDDETLSEFDKKQIKFSEEDNQAVLSVSASQTTFDQTYKCVASNSYGDGDKYFKLCEISKPDKPRKVNIVATTHSQIFLNVSWNYEINFPVKGFQIQHFLTAAINKIKPTTDKDWKKAVQSYTEIVDDVYEDNTEIPLVIEGLEKDTSYWIRVRATNDAGVSPWSDAVKAATAMEEVVYEVEDTIEPEPKPVAKAEVSNADAAFYGIFFAGGMAVVAVVCMFAMRMV